MKTFLLSGVVVLAAACAPASPTRVSREFSGSPSSACDAHAATGDDEVVPLFRKYCSSCHSPGGSAGAELDWLDEVKRHSSRRAIGAKVDAGAMPPTGELQPTGPERERIVAWAKCAAPT